MFSKRSSVFRAMAFLAILYVTAAAQPQQQRHQVLENKDLTDLLDADLDEPFRQQPGRRLQEEGMEGMTQAPTSAPTAAPADSEDGERGFVSFAPTPAATSMRDLLTEAPVTSGASSGRSSAGVASALVFAGSVAAAAMMA